MIMALMTIVFLGGVDAQSILVEGVDGRLIVNGKTIELLPDGLDFGEAEFSLRSVRSFPLHIKVNEVFYEIWEDRVLKTDGGESADFNMTIEANGESVAIESNSSLDMENIVNALSQRIRDVFSMDDLTGRHLPDGFSGSLMEELLEFEGSRAMGAGSFPQYTARMLELSNYLMNVRNGSSELFELLWHELGEEAEAIEMATKIRELEFGLERDIAIKELEAKLDEIFSMKQENRRMETKYLKQEIERMEERIRERSRAKDRLIDARMDELLGGKE